MLFFRPVGHNAVIYHNHNVSLNALCECYFRDIKLRRLEPNEDICFVFRDNRARSANLTAYLRGGILYLITFSIPVLLAIHLAAGFVTNRFLEDTLGKDGTEALKLYLDEMAGLTVNDLEAKELVALALAMDSETSNGVDAKTAARCAVEDLLEGNLELA